MNKPKYPVGKPNATEREYAMSWEEIGQALGISRKGAVMIYISAMRKIRNRPGAIRALAQTVHFRQQMEAQRLRSGLGRNDGHAI
jgi:biotin operon repressor